MHILFLQRIEYTNINLHNWTLSFYSSYFQSTTVSLTLLRHCCQSDLQLYVFSVGFPSVFPYAPDYIRCQPSTTARAFETNFALRSYGITHMTFPTFSPLYSPWLSLCIYGLAAGERRASPSAWWPWTCGLGIIGLQLQQSNELALIWRMTPFTLDWLPAASTAAPFIHAGSGFYCIDLAGSQMSECNTIPTLIYESTFSG